MFKKTNLGMSQDKELKKIINKSGIMSMSDPVADLLTRIRNANMRNKDSLELLSSKMKLSIVKVLKDEGFINFESL